MRWSALAPCACLAALCGCGGDDAPADAVTVASGDALVVRADEYAFDPGRIVVSGASKPVRITLDNAGSLAHDLVVLDGERRLAGTRPFPAGEKRTFALRARPGSYRFVCTVGDHEELGMAGTLEVR